LIRKRRRGEEEEQVTMGRRGQVGMNKETLGRRGKEEKKERIWEEDEERGRTRRPSSPSNHLVCR
jgi:hypothetical protein